MFELIGCPLHLGVSNEGLKDGIQALNRRFPELSIRLIPEIILPEDNLPNLKNLNSVAASCREIARETDRVIQSGNIPLFIGGDHSSAMGSVSGSAVNHRGMGLLWIDAHSDINTDVSTLTGNIHGMPVSALMGFGNETLCGIYSERLPSPELPKILPQHVVLYGVRDMDPLEVEIVERLGVRTYSYEEIQRRGQEECLREVAEYLSECPCIHVSFDLDGMDPQEIKGVSVPVPGGFHEEDVFFQFAWLQSHCRIGAVDIVEYNPALDSDGMTGDFVDRLIHRIIGSVSDDEGRFHGSGL